MRDGAVRILKQLLATGSLPASCVRRQAQEDLAPLIQSGAIASVRAGAGLRYEVVDAEALAGQLREARPALSLAEDVPPRARAAWLLRDAKRGQAAYPQVLLLRAWGADGVLANGTDELDIAALTRRFGIAALTVCPQDAWAAPGALGLIENLEAFFHAERLPGAHAVGCVVYYGGFISNQFLDWLAARPRAREIRHFPDYDPVGLANYLRLRERSAAPVRLVVPATIEECFRAGKRRLLSDQASTLRKLAAVEDPLVRRLVGLMRIYGCGVEQEMLLAQTENVEC